LSPCKFDCFLSPRLRSSPSVYAAFCFFRRDLARNSTALSLPVPTVCSPKVILPRARFLLCGLFSFFHKCWVLRPALHRSIIVSFFYTPPISDSPPQRRTDPRMRFGPQVAFHVDLSFLFPHVIPLGISVERPPVVDCPGTNLCLDILGPSKVSSFPIFLSPPPPNNFYQFPAYSPPSLEVRPEPAIPAHLALNPPLAS